MIKQTYSSIVFIIAFLALMIASPSANLLAQTAEERSSVTSSTRSTNSTTVAQPAREQSFDTSTTRSTKSTTVAQATGEHHCAGNCRDRFNESIKECNEPNHPNHNKCEKWARESEEKCLAQCNRE
jgi:hypothetical protein